MNNNEFQIKISIVATTCESKPIMLEGTVSHETARKIYDSFVEDAGSFIGLPALEIQDTH